jgi:voltage-gated potassium channel Kch
VTAVLLASGTIFYTNVEGWTVLDALYFCVATLTTVGYGDLAPTTAVGKIFTIMYILGGIGVLVGFVSKVGEQQTRDRRRRGCTTAAEKQSAAATPREPEIEE